MKWTKRKIVRIGSALLVVAVILVAVFQIFMRPEIDTMRCMACMKGIPMAFYGYQDEHGTFPPAYTVDAEGNRLHSWRTLLLPYLGEKELYEKIRLDEPWNSEYNRQFHDRPWFNWEPGVCTCCCPVVRRKLPHGKNAGQYTNYMVVEGPGLVFEGTNATKQADIQRGTSNTILLVESTVAVPWMCPVDLPIDAARQGIVPMKSGVFGIGGGHSKGIAHFCLADGSVHAESPERLSQDLLPELFRKDGTAAFPW